jgi:anthranilate/para-aminobenzoate synthase component II
MHPVLCMVKLPKSSMTEKLYFHDVAESFIATRYHSLALQPDTIPEELEISAKTPDGVIMGVRHREYPIEGIQFHPESILTTEGPKILRNWLRMEFKEVKVK